jgi:hypothetical protein
LAKLEQIDLIKFELSLNFMFLFIPFFGFKSNKIFKRIGIKLVLEIIKIIDLEIDFLKKICSKNQSYLEIQLVYSELFGYSIPS